MTQRPVATVVAFLAAVLCSAGIAAGVLTAQAPSTGVPTHMYGGQLERISEDIAKCLKHDESDPEGRKAACTVAASALDSLKDIAAEFNNVRRGLPGAPKGVPNSKVKPARPGSEKALARWRGNMNASLLEKSKRGGFYTAVTRICVQGGGTTRLCLLGSFQSVDPDNDSLREDFEECVQHWITTQGEC